MKQIEDTRAFERIPLSLVRKSGTFRIYSTRRQTGITPIPLFLNDEQTQPLYIPVIFSGRTDSQYGYRQVNCPYLGVEYVKEGSLTIRQNGICRLIEPGEVFLMQPGVDSEIITGPEGYCIKESFPVKGDLLLSFLEKTGLLRKDYVSNFDWERLEQILERLKESALRTSAESEAEKLIANNLLTYEILERLAFPIKRMNPASKPAQILNYMRENLEKTLTLQMLAKRFECSENNILQIFHSAYGQSPHQKLIDLRMEHAARLIQSYHELSIKEISMRTGYSNPMNFSTAFRQRYGISPKKYRTQKNWIY